MQPTKLVLVFARNHESFHRFIKDITTHITPSVSFKASLSGHWLEIYDMRLVYCSRPEQVIGVRDALYIQLPHAGQHPEWEAVLKEIKVREAVGCLRRVDPTKIFPI